MKTPNLTTPSSFPTIGFAALSAMAVLAASSHNAQAQRPSLGGLQQQVNNLRTGNLDFEEVGVGGVVRFGGGECTIGIDPTRAGLRVSEPSGVRLLTPAGGSGLLIFGPTDECTVGASAGGGIFASDPVGFRVLNPQGGSSRLLFGPTDDCTIGIDPGGLGGLLLRDPIGVRVLPPQGVAGRLLFGPTDDCTIGIDPQLPGLAIRDPEGVRLLAGPGGSPRVIFGPTDDCTIGIDPQLPGLALRDPDGLRLLGAQGQASQLIFGPTDECRIFVGPQSGLFLEDPNGVNVQAPAGFQTTLNVSGDVVADRFIIRSSRDRKEDIRTLENPLDTVRKLRGVNYRTKKEFGGKAAMGFIAEEVAEVLPQVTAFDKDGKPAGVHYANMVALVVEGVKDQQDQIEDLKAENGQLKEDLEALKAQMAELARSLNPDAH